MDFFILFLFRQICIYFTLKWHEIYPVNLIMGKCWFNFQTIVFCWMLISNLELLGQYPDLYGCLFLFRFIGNIKNIIYVQWPYNEATFIMLSPFTREEKITKHNIKTYPQTCLSEFCVWSWPLHIYNNRQTNCESASIQLLSSSYMWMAEHAKEAK